MEYQMTINQEITIEVYAFKPFSEDCIKVKQDEKYRFSVSPNDTWKDWFFRSTASGFWNIFLPRRQRRLSTAKCFELCGTIGRDENNHFAIGMAKEWTSEKEGNLYFFANDSKFFKYYRNNKGKIRLQIIRVG